MKIKIDFITNSSSANFSISKTFLSEADIILIKNHMDIAIMIGDKDTMQYAGKHDYWSITEDDDKLYGSTSMDNFDMMGFLVDIMKLNPDIIKYEHHG